MKNIVNVTICTAVIAVSAAFTTSANADAIADRKAAMKTIGKSIGAAAKMAKGEVDFDGQAALAAFLDMKNAASGFGALFPDGTETGGNTEAAPAIFSDRAGFDQKNSDFSASLEKVTASAPANLAELGAALGEVGKNCKACHQTYRVKKN